MKQTYVLSYDLGTSGVKAALVNMQGEVITTKTAAYPLYTPQPGWGEQDPEDYWRGVCAVTHSVMESTGTSPSSIAGMAFGTQWKGIIPVDAQGNVLHRSIIWMDSRAESQAQRLNERFGADCCFRSSEYWPRLMWLQENMPDIVEKAQWILEANSFLKWKATGEAAVDISNCFTRSFDPELDAFYQEVLKEIGIPREKFPRLVASHEMVGRVTAKAANELGLVEGIPVFGGCNDIQAVTVGSGCAEIDGVHIYLGSSGWAGYTIPHPPGFRPSISPFDQDRDIRLLGLHSVGLSFNWAAHKLYAPEFQEMGDDVFALIDREVAEIPAGSDGVLATHWFYGESPPVYDYDARGCFLNLGPQHDRRHMTRALMESICYHLKQYAAGGGPVWPKVFHAIGGGSCSDVWMQILADVLGAPVRVPYSPRHAGAIGTAYCALIGLGAYADYSNAAKALRFEREFIPNPEVSAAYQKSYAMYVRLYPILKPIFQHMNG